MSVRNMGSENSREFSEPILRANADEKSRRHSAQHLPYQNQHLTGNHWGIHPAHPQAATHRRFTQRHQFPSGQPTHE